MKLFIIAAVLIASVFAEPESDAEAKPWLAYSNYGAYGAYPYAAATYAHGAYPYAGVYGAGVYGNGYNGYALGGAHYIGKRSSDSDAEAKPWLAYSNYGAYGAYPYAASTYGAYPYAGVYGAGVYGHGYNGYALGGAHYIGKRSAEGEAKPEAWYSAYRGYGGGYGGYGGYAGYASRPYSYGYASPYSYGGYGGGYGGYGAYGYGK